MKRLALLIACACACAGPSAARDLDALIRGDVERGFSGAVRVMRGDRVLVDAGYGEVRGVRVEASSRFWIASVGKQFTAAAILRCRERGWLDLDDPIGRFFPDAPDDKRAITIRQLLAHVAGLDQTYASEGARDRADAVARIFARPVIDRPGARFHYSNDDDQLAAAIVEVASGERYADFVRRELFAPAGLTDTGFAGEPGSERVLPAEDPRPERLSAPSWGAQGVFSTTADLARWMRALRGGRVLVPADVDALFAPVAPIEEGKTALGWFVGTSARGVADVFVRGNEDWGPNALVYAYPSRDELIIVLTHAGDADGDRSWSRFVLGQLEARLER